RAPHIGCPGQSLRAPARAALVLPPGHEDFVPGTQATFLRKGVGLSDTRWGYFVAGAYAFCAYRPETTLAPIRRELAWTVSAMFRSTGGGLGRAVSLQSAITDAMADITRSVMPSRSSRRICA